jgi:ribonuclease III
LTSEGESGRAAALAALEKRLGHSFQEPELLRTALRHSSHANENAEGESNERLEFLGDAVIGLVIGEMLFRAQPGWQEGELTRGLHHLVDKAGCAKLARSLELGALLELGRTEEQSDGANKDSILANAFEAVMGALFLDGGLAAVTSYSVDAYSQEWPQGMPPAERDAKTLLQERVMAQYGAFPRYELISDSAVEGAEERFTSRVLLREETMGIGRGRTKRGAEFDAARRALEALPGPGERDPS